MQAFGHDKSLTFVRHTRILDPDKDEDKSEWILKGLGTLNAPRPPSFDKIGYNNWSRRSYYGDGQLTIVGFCGKKYILYDIDGRIYTSVTEFFESVDKGTSVDNFEPIDCFGDRAKKKGRAKRLKEHRDFVAFKREQDRRVRGLAKDSNEWSASRNNFYFTEIGWKQWQESVRNKMVIPDETHRYWKTPIIAWNNEYVINPCLKELGFQKIVDPYTAFQEIDMYLGNNMADQFDPTLGRTDNEIRDSHGMDKWSFRNPAPGRKKRKQKKKT